MKISRRFGGLIRLRLDAGEAAGLTALLDELITLVEAGPADDPVLSRPFPAAYRDAEQAAEFRELTRSSLADERVQRAMGCRVELADLPTGGSTLELDETAGTRWMQVLNDLRLAIGTRLGVTEHDPDAEPDAQPDRRNEAGEEPDPDGSVPPRAVYDWLTWMQDSLVRALMK